MRGDYNYLDLFHGIGGFALGAHWAGMKFKNHFCSDIEPYPVRLYKKRFPDSIQLGDITKIDFEKLKKDYPGEWILTGGFPCQDISVAGKGKGLIHEGEKTRSGLWFDYWKGISILRPRFVIIENVRALLNRGLETVLSNLAEIGYNAEWQVISAENMGAPHKRERVWIIAYPSEFRCNLRGSEGKRIQRKNKSCDKINTGSQAKMANTDKKRESQSKGIKQDKRKRIIDNSEKMGDPKSTGQQSGIDGQREVQFGGAGTRDRKCQREWWTSEPAVGRLVNGLSGRVDRLKGLGNAIVPQIAELLFNQIKENK